MTRGFGFFAVPWVCALQLATRGGQSFAVKILEKSDLPSTTAIDKVYSEVSTLTRLQHVNIVKMHELVETEDRIMLVMEYANGGELSRFWVFFALCSVFETRITGGGAPTIMTISAGAPLPCHAILLPLPGEDSSLTMVRALCLLRTNPAPLLPHQVSQVQNPSH